jgi:hypothetical protein
VTSRLGTGTFFTVYILFVSCKKFNPENSYVFVHIFILVLFIRDVPIWLIWLKYLSWFLYGFEALLINQWDGIENITCPAEVRTTNKKQSTNGSAEDCGLKENRDIF